MAKRTIRLVLSDVDGTLVTPEKELTDGAKRAVRELQDAGIDFAITSGRPPRGMAMLIKPLNLKTPIAAFNGGAFVNPDLSPVRTHMLDPGASEQAVKYLLDKGLDVWVYTENDWLVRDLKAPHVAKESSTVQFDAKIVKEFTSEHLARATKIVGVSDDNKLMAETDKTLHDQLGKQASVSRSQAYYLDITPPEANKGNVVRELSRLLNIPQNEIATIGDMPNDIPMFEQGGFSVAMGQASDQVKSAADAVTGSNEDDGFAKAITELVLAEAAVR
jgi:Cof subfamily protein (haloacid dehalogenase superfamily)